MGLKEVEEKKGCLVEQELNSYSKEERMFFWPKKYYKGLLQGKHGGESHDRSNKDTKKSNRTMQMRTNRVDQVHWRLKDGENHDMT